MACGALLTASRQHLVRPLESSFPIIPSLGSCRDDVHCRRRGQSRREANVDRNRSLITAAEDFAYMLEVRPGAFINIGNAGNVGSCPVHSPNYDFNDEALPIGASLFARLAEKKLPRLSGN